MHHEIEITRKGDKVRLPEPMPEMHVHDTVHYSFKSGLVKIRFEGGSPFATDVVTSENEPMELMRDGAFTSHCTSPGSRILPAGNVVPRITRAT